MNLADQYEDEIKNLKILCTSNIDNICKEKNFESNHHTILSPLAATDVSSLESQVSDNSRLFIGKAPNEPSLIISKSQTNGISYRQSQDNSLKVDAMKSREKNFM